MSPNHDDDGGPEEPDSRFLGRLAHARAALGAAQKPGAGVPAYLRWVNRRLGRWAAALAFACGGTPNQVTALSGLASIAGMAVMALVPPSVSSAVTASVLLLLGYALDSADGQLARLSRSGSRAGEWLDHVVDAARLPAFHLAVAISLYRREDMTQMWPVACAIVFMLVASVWFFAQNLAEQLMGTRPVVGRVDAPVWVSFAKMHYDVSTLYLLVLLLPWVWVFVTGYVALLVLTVVVAAGSLVRKYQGLRQVGSEQLLAAEG